MHAWDLEPTRFLKNWIADAHFTPMSKNVPLLQNCYEQVYSFSLVPRTNYHKPIGLKQHTFCILHFCGSEVWWKSHWANSKVSSSFPCLSHAIISLCLSFLVTSPFPLLRTLVITFSSFEQLRIAPYFYISWLANLIPIFLLNSSLLHNHTDSQIQGIRPWTCFKGHYSASLRKTMNKYLLASYNNFHLCFLMG